MGCAATFGNVPVRAGERERPRAGTLEHGPNARAGWGAGSRGGVDLAVVRLAVVATLRGVRSGRSADGRQGAHEALPRPRARARAAVHPAAGARRGGTLRPRHAGRAGAAVATPGAALRAFVALGAGEALTFGAQLAGDGFELGVHALERSPTGRLLTPPRQQRKGRECLSSVVAEGGSTQPGNAFPAGGSCTFGAARLRAVVRGRSDSCTLAVAVPDTAS